MTSDDGPEPLLVDILGYRAPPLGAVRQRVAKAARHLGGTHLLDVLVVVDELVTNVHEHAPGPGRLRLRFSLRPCRVQVEVDDTSFERPVLGRSRLGPGRGLGLVVVDGLAREWGVQFPPGGGKTTWAVVRCPGEGCRGHVA